MGNRAFIYPAKGKTKKKLGVYLHWNGGPDSVIPLIKYCKIRGFRSFSDGYGVARLATVMGNFFGGTLSLGIEYAYPDCVDVNHTPYAITDDWEIANIEEYRLNDGDYPTDNEVLEMMKEINNAQPEKDRVPLEFLTSTEQPSLTSIKVGQKVIYLDPVTEEYKTATVAAIDPDGVPRLKLYDSPFCPWNENRNNRLDGYKFRLVK